MKNLLLLLLLIAGIWYFLVDKPVATPPPAPVAQAAPPPPPRVDYSGVRTFYSPLDDPPVPANGHSGYSSAVVLGGTSAVQGVNGGYNTATTTYAPAQTTPDRATSSIGLGGAGNR